MRASRSGMRPAMGRMSDVGGERRPRRWRRDRHERGCGWVSWSSLTTSPWAIVGGAAASAADPCGDDGIVVACRETGAQVDGARPRGSGRSRCVLWLVCVCVCVAQGWRFCVWQSAYEDRGRSLSRALQHRDRDRGRSAFCDSLSGVCRAPGSQQAQELIRVAALPSGVAHRSLACVPYRIFRAPPTRRARHRPARPHWTLPCTAHTPVTPRPPEPQATPGTRSGLG